MYRFPILINHDVIILYFLTDYYVIIQLAHDMYKHKRLKHGEEYQTKKRARIEDEKVAPIGVVKVESSFDLIKT